MLACNTSKQRKNRAKSWRESAAAVLFCLASSGVATPAFADQAGEPDPAQASTSIANPATKTDGLSFNLPNTLGDPSFNRPLDITNSAIGSTLFKLDISDPNCLTSGEPCLRRNDQIDVGVSRAFSSISEKGLDLSITPRAAMRFEDDSTSTLFGAKFEIGDDLRAGTGLRSNTWYVFAGADAESITYGPNALGRMDIGQFYLQDNILIGDAQAGVGFRAGDTDVSLSYMRREARGDDLNYSEDAAALSFTWKR